MERYRVSGEDLRGSYAAGAVLRDVFRDIERDLQVERRVVCQYVVNGMALAEKDEGRFATIDLRDVESLEYLSEKTDVLLRDVIAGWLKAIPELQAGAEGMAARLKGGVTQGILKGLHDLVENCEFLVSSLMSARGLIGDIAAADIDGFDRVDEMTRATFREAIRCFEAQDFVQLALVIEYDLNHGLEEWTTLLKKLHRRLADRDGGDHDDATSDSMDRRRGTC